MSTPAINPLGALANTVSTQQPNSGGTNGLANENTFLKLLVAQLKNQDPLNPQDGTQFVAQLAQFSGLEQTIQMRQDLDSIKGVLNTAPSTAAANQPTSSTDTTTKP